MSCFSILSASSEPYAICPPLVHSFEYYLPLFLLCPISVLYEPTSTEKAAKFIHAGVQSLVQYTTPNLPELKQMYAVFSGNQSLAQDLHVVGKTRACTNVCTWFEWISAVVEHSLTVAAPAPRGQLLSSLPLLHNAAKAEGEDRGWPRETIAAHTCFS